MNDDVFFGERNLQKKIQDPAGIRTQYVMNTRERLTTIQKVLGLNPSWITDFPMDLFLSLSTKILIITYLRCDVHLPGTTCSDLSATLSLLASYS